MYTRKELLCLFYERLFFELRKCFFFYAWSFATCCRARLRTDRFRPLSGLIQQNRPEKELSRILKIFESNSFNLRCTVGSSKGCKVLSSDESSENRKVVLFFFFKMIQLNYLIW